MTAFYRNRVSDWFKVQSAVFKPFQKVLVSKMWELTIQLIENHTCHSSVENFQCCLKNAAAAIEPKNRTNWNFSSMFVLQYATYLVPKEGLWVGPPLQVSQQNHWHCCNIPNRPIYGTEKYILWFSWIV